MLFDEETYKIEERMKKESSQNIERLRVQIEWSVFGTASIFIRNDERIYSFINAKYKLDYIL